MAKGWALSENKDDQYDTWIIDYFFPRVLSTLLLMFLYLIVRGMCSKDMEVDSTAPAAAQPAPPATAAEQARKGEMMEGVEEEDDNEELKAALAMSMEMEDAGKGVEQISWICVGRLWYDESGVFERDLW